MILINMLLDSMKSGSYLKISNFNELSAGLARLSQAENCILHLVLIKYQMSFDSCGVIESLKVTKLESYIGKLI